MTLHKRFQQCNRNIGAKPLNMGSKEYDELEYFLTYMSNGLPMQTPVFRK
jgi:sulfur-oxidizing protein SoxA